MIKHLKAYIKKNNTTLEHVAAKAWISTHHFEDIKNNREVPDQVIFHILTRGFFKRNDDARILIDEWKRKK